MKRGTNSWYVYCDFEEAIFSIAGIKFNATIDKEFEFLEKVFGYKNE